MVPAKLKKALVPLAIAIAIAAFQFFERPDAGSVPATARVTAPAQGNSAPASQDSLAAAISRRAKDVWIEGQGEVVKVLPDDNEGSRHQRFLVRVSGGGTVLIAHNIDLAPRVGPLAAGMPVTFRGEYVWNDRGGVVHWTHHDPQGRHAGGWIRSGGRIFE